MPEAPWLPQFEAYARDVAESNQVPGMAVAVAQHGEVVYQAGFGYRDVQQALPATPDTVFPIASVTKTFTGLAIMQLEEAGRLSVHDPIVKWLPEFKLSDPKYQREITIRHLLTHSSGLPEFANAHIWWGWAYPGVLQSGARAITTYEEVTELMTEKKVDLLAPPGRFFCYSNEGYALLAWIVERASGKNYVSHLREHIWEPLGMTRTASLTEALAEVPGVSQFYGRRREDDKEVVFASPLHYGQIFGCDGLASTVRDLVRYFEVYRNKGLVDGQRIVSPAAIEKMMMPQVQSPSGLAYGYGMMLRLDYHGVTLAFHGGGSGAHVSLAVEKQTTVAVLSNLGHPAIRVSLGAINAVLGLPLDTWLFEFPEYELTPEQLARFVGTYGTPHSGPYWELRFYLQDGVLYMESEGQSVATRPYAEDAVVSGEDPRQGLRFLMDSDGAVWAAHRMGHLFPKVE